ncbi:MAG: Wzz/FepE/Etk N-terminal domain-containing protein [Thiovulaceae bacterium]|nr:Wzz/FepE/Etk N-terminal domain-containing protein [Sulfurimonadaceae bacterium]
MEKQVNKTFYEDEIDLVELFKTLWDKKIFILIFTFIVTASAVLYAYSKTQIYEVKSNVQIGFIGYDEKNEQQLLDNPSSIVKKLNIVFEVEEKTTKIDKFISVVTDISQNKKVKNYIEIKTEATLNEEALKKNKEVLEYLKKLYKPKIDLKSRDILNKINDTKRLIKNIDEFQIKNLEYELSVLEKHKLTQIDKKIDVIKNQDIKKLEKQIKNIKEQKIASIDKKIDVIKNQDIKKLEKQIENINEQEIVKIDEKIKFLHEQTLPSINNKINFHTKKLEEYIIAVNNIVENMKKSSDPSFTTISSIQMVNYQNLILGSQNKIEDLKISKKTIESETIPSLQREKKNFIEITIRDLSLKIKNLINIILKNLKKEKNNLQEIDIRDIKLKIKNLEEITLVNLEKEKQNIQNDTLRKLKYKIDVTLVNEKIKLEQKIKDLEYKLSKNYMQNSSLVGKYIVKDYPVKPKKKLIVVIAFVTGLILSIFLVFLIDFFRKLTEAKSLSKT